jgi:hypothetical protein
MAQPLRILSVSAGTLGFLDTYVSGTTLCYMAMGKNHGAHTTAICPARMWRARGGRVYPPFESHPHFEVIRKGDNDARIEPEDYGYFLEQLAGRTFDVLSDLNGTNLELTGLLQDEFQIPAVLTVEQAGSRAGLPVDACAAYPPLSADWQAILRQMSAVITWHINDIGRLAVIGGGIVPVHHVYFGLDMPASAQKLACEPKDREQACYIGSIFANPAHWKCSAELEQAVPLILEHTPIRKFCICGSCADGQAQPLIDRLVSRYPGRILYEDFKTDREAALAVLAQSFFVYTPVGHNQIGCLPVEAWALRTPILMTNSTYVEDRITGIRPAALDDIPDRIQELYRDGELYRTIQDNGRKHYEAHFTPNAMAAAYGWIFSGVAGAWKGRNVTMKDKV